MDLGEWYQGAVLGSGMDVKSRGATVVDAGRPAGFRVAFHGDG